MELPFHAPPGGAGRQARRVSICWAMRSCASIRMSAHDETHKSLRYRLGELLRDSADNILLLTATPYQGSIRSAMVEMEGTAVAGLHACGERQSIVQARQSTLLDWCVGWIVG